MLKVGEIIQTIKGIVETKVELIKMEIQDEFLGVISRLVLLVLIGAVLLLVLLFLSLTTAFYLSSLTGKPFMGFLLVSLFYMLILAGLFYTRYSPVVQRKIQGALRNFILRNKKDSDHD
ncbi:phage holin family protein [Algoriphagus namhaensis]